MSFKSSKKPPLTPNHFDEEPPPLDKRRKLQLERTGMAPPQPPPPSRLRQPLSTVNAAPNAAPDPPASDAGSSGIEFSCREDVDRLLNEKMRGKNKMDYKGKSEQMLEYIKKLRACIKWYMELEDGYLMEQEKLRSSAESEQMRHNEIEAEMRKSIEERDMRIGELDREYALLKESFSKEEAAKLEMTRCWEGERDGRVAAESSLAALSVELERTSEEVKRANDQIKMLQETNRRLQEYNTSLQQYNSNLQADAQQHGETISKLQKEKNAMTESLANLRSKNSSIENQLSSYKSSQQEAVKQTEDLNKEVCHLRSELRQVRDSCQHHLLQIENLTAEVARYKELSGNSTKDLNNIMTERCALEETLSSQREQIQTLNCQLTAANERLKSADITTSQTKDEFEVQRKLVKELQARVEDADFQLLEAENLRKKLHNTILELKGNIRVFCRVRPILSDYDTNNTDGAIVSFPTSTEVLGRGIDLMHNAQKYSFTFDKVFTHDASQEDVFVEISQLVQSALDGYKVCIFAYGQTGSGKTYTMMGKREATEQKGMIPRSLEQIFQMSQSLRSQGWKFTMQASMLEIYNETIRDLLSPGRSGSLEANAALSKQYTIKHDSNGNTLVSDLTIVNVCTMKEVSFLLDQAAHSRSVGKTHMNEQSSRSHFVFTLRISGVNENTEQQVQGVLNLIDLAGSERLKQSGSTGDRLKETQAINKSLSALSDVIFAIAKKEDHVPFRNSKLTYLLQPCLGGDSKTLMFVNVSPEGSSTGESICSLRFAARVNSCEIGVPRRHTQGRMTDARLSNG